MLSRAIIAFGMAFLMGASALADGGGAAPSQPSDYRKAVKAIKKEDYAKAIDLLNSVLDKNPKNANAWNYMGYSLRNLERYDDALAAYEKALAIKPKHKGALEYLGELYLQTDQLDKARVQLEKLDAACFFSCKEYTKLKKRIAKYEASG